MNDSSHETRVIAISKDPKCHLLFWISLSWNISANIEIKTCSGHLSLWGLEGGYPNPTQQDLSVPEGSSQVRVWVGLFLG